MNSELKSEQGDAEVARCRHCGREPVLSYSEYCAEHHTLFNPTVAQRRRMRREDRLVKAYLSFFFGSLAVLIIFALYMGFQQPNQPERRQNVNPDTYDLGEYCPAGDFIGC